MTAINGISYGPIITLNEQIGIKVTEDGRASLKSLTDMDALFLGKSQTGAPAQGVTFNFLDDRTEMPLDQKAELRRTWTKNMTIETAEGKTELRRNWSILGRHSVQVTTPKGNFSIQKLNGSHDDYTIKSPQGDLKIAEAGRGLGGKLLQLTTPKGNYEVFRPQPEAPDYSIAMPGGDAISVHKLPSLGRHFQVEMPFGQGFDIMGDMADNWTIKTPSGRNVEIHHDRAGNPMGWNYTVKTDYGTFKVLNPKNGQYKLPGAN